MVSQQDIADRLNISRSLVSKVLNGHLGTTKVRPETAKAIIDMAQRLGYKPDPTAVSLATGRHGTIGLLVRRFGIPASRLADSLANTITEEAHLAGQKILLTFYSNETKERCFELLTECRRVDGLIFAGRIHEQIAAALAEFEDVPVVAISAAPAGPHMSHVNIDGTAIGYVATGHLLEQGCRRIAHIHTMDNRLDGWRRALREASIEPDEALIYSTHFHGHKDGIAAVRHFLDSGVSFDAVEAQSDVQAAGVINELTRCGLKVPQDVKVIGVDNSLFCDIFPCPISSVSLNYREAARQGVQILMEAVNNPNLPARHVEIQPTVVPRQSTAKASS